jgi:hypothetical protein
VGVGIGLFTSGVSVSALDDGNVFGELWFLRRLLNLHLEEGDLDAFRLDTLLDLLCELADMPVELNIVQHWEAGHESGSTHRVEDDG